MILKTETNSLKYKNELEFCKTKPEKHQFIVKGILCWVTEY